ncbi:hypothetical protein ISTM_331 [Insectomime virus]|uniref:MORN repeat-containing protein n=1 Tax=Tunisvirus fontaine2 TaxID=1421067 RepID=V9SFS2_9VIRU|nr:hypothetical protein D1R32_gp469 [Tunisvirus fontaine2]AHA46229.1 hypothetical protein ISTM_331 [Insectomime virus]AHC55186.1 hypothetical protein TNS_ORF468 [Tunisvirus fontaine2]
MKVTILSKFFIVGKGMHKFLEYREVISLSLCDGGSNLSKKDYVVVSIFAERPFGSVRVTLPNGELVHKTKNGTYHSPDDGAKTCSETTTQEYKNGKKHGKYTFYRIRYKEPHCLEKDEIFTTEGSFRHGKPHGVFTNTHRGILQETCLFSNGRLVECAEYLFPNRRLLWTTFSTNEKECIERHITKVALTEEGALAIEEQTIPFEGICRERVRIILPQLDVEDLNKEKPFEKLRDRNISRRLVKEHRE